MKTFLNKLRKLKLGSTIALLLLTAIWSIPTVGLLITSLHRVQGARNLLCDFDRFDDHSIAVSSDSSASRNGVFSKGDRTSANRQLSERLDHPRRFCAAVGNLHFEKLHDVDTSFTYRGGSR